MKYVIARSMQSMGARKVRHEGEHVKHASTLNNTFVTDTSTTLLVGNQTHTNNLERFVTLCPRLSDQTFLDLRVT